MGGAGGEGMKDLNRCAGWYLRVYARGGPFEEGILNSWIGGLGAHELG